MVLLPSSLAGIGSKTGFPNPSKAREDEHQDCLWYTLGCGPPPRMPVTNEGLAWDSLLKMVHNPGGDWNRGWGVYLRGHILTVAQVHIDIHQFNQRTQFQLLCKD